MNRRTFLISSGAAGVGALLPVPAVGNTAETDSAERFSWNTGKLQLEFSVVEGRLRQHLILPVGVESARESLQWAGVEIGPSVHRRRFARFRNEAVCRISRAAPEVCRKG